MNQREASVRHWATRTGTGASIEEINSGCLQRIADAAEKMAANYTALQNDRDWYKKHYEESTQTLQYLERRVASLRGVITKLKNRKPETWGAIAQ